MNKMCPFRENQSQNVYSKVSNVCAQSITTTCICNWQNGTLPDWPTDQCVMSLSTMQGQWPW